MRQGPAWIKEVVRVVTLLLGIICWDGAVLLTAVKLPATTAPWMAVGTLAAVAVTTGGVAAFVVGSVWRRFP